jgi:predicted nucleic acid-binding protein
VIIPDLPTTPSQWALCLSPLLLIPPIFFLLRRRRYAITPDFVDAMVFAEKVDIMPRRRRKWVTPEGVWPAFDGRVEQDVDLGELISPQEHSDSDARDLMDRMGVSMEDAILLVVARRAKRLCTQDERIASLAGALEIEVFDAERFIETHDRGAKGRR